MYVLYDCAIILIATKALGMFTRKLGLPQVVGMIIAGILIGPAVFSQLNIGFKGIINPTPTEKEVLHSFSQIGVVFILFSSGLETDVRELKKSGLASTMIALAGVFVPIALGTLGALLFMHGFGAGASHEKFMNAMFVGCILAATSVGITVETLREMGKLNTKVGTTVLSAAIIDDVIGIVALSIISGLNGDGNIGITIVKAISFFVFTIGVGFLMRILFKHLVKAYPHKRRTSIFALSMCLLYAFCAEEFFDIASITGAYMAGLMLSGLDDTSFVDKKIIVSGYMIFTPIFFAYIGISADFSQITLNGLLFAIVFVLLGISGKILGCSAVAKAFKYKNNEALTIGCGMIARGEVALAVYAAGQELIYKENGIVMGIDPLVATICLIVTSSILCPILLKITFKDHSNDVHNADGKVKGTSIHSQAIENALENHSSN